jgi:hypothetical protein
MTILSSYEFILFFILFIFLLLRLLFRAVCFVLHGLSKSLNKGRLRRLHFYFLLDEVSNLCFPPESSSKY